MPELFDPTARLTRRALAKALTEAGYPIAYGTLQTKASRGGGPPYEIFGRVALHTWGPSLAWAKARTSGPVSNASELHRRGHSLTLREAR
jgi:hypothetical protein